MRPNIIGAALALALTGCATSGPGFSASIGGSSRSDLRQPCMADSECTQSGYLCQLGVCIPRDGGAPPAAKPPEPPPPAVDTRQPCVVDSDCSAVAGQVCRLNLCAPRP